MIAHVPEPVVIVIICVPPLYEQGPVVPIATGRPESDVGLIAKLVP